MNNLNTTMAHRNNAQRNSYRERQASVDRFLTERKDNRKSLDSDINFDELQEQALSQS